MVQEAQKLELIQIILTLQDEELLAKLKTILNTHTSKKTGSGNSFPNKGAHNIRQFGFAKGLITYVAPDFDETPPGFEEYMPEA